MIEFQNSLEYALGLDAADPLRAFREKFHIPQTNGIEQLYFCGNSLGLQPKTTKQYIAQELEDWQYLAVEGHFHGRNPWYPYHHQFKEPLARIVGAKPGEVVAMNTLTTNLHLMMVSFYRPEGKRHKIIIEGGAFPSDRYAVQSQIRYHGFDPESAMIELLPRANEFTMRTEDILNVIEEHADELALVLLGGVQYYTGQRFDMKTITRAGHDAGALVGFDLAHAVGNVELQLHNWNADFAVWCSYKYLNSGPGGVGGAFVHERHGKDSNIPRFAGWWGTKEETRFAMPKGFEAAEGADGWQLSNAQILPMAAHKASLDIFDEAGIKNIFAKRDMLTGYLEFLLKEIIRDFPAIPFEILTPSERNERGCQMSILIHTKGRALFEHLTKNNIIVDWREPNVIRISPAPLYNSFEEVFRVCNQIREACTIIWVDEREGREEQVPHLETP